MTRKSQEAADTEPIVPEGWSGEPLLVIFYIPAPWPLSIPTGSTFAFSNDEKVPWLKGVAQQLTDEVGARIRDSEDDSGFASILVGRTSRDTTADTWQVEAAFDFCAFMCGRAESRIREPSPKVERDVTVFEVVTPLIPKFSDGEIDIDKSVSDGFDRCLEAVNELLRAYSVAAKDYHVVDLTRHRVESIVPWTTRFPDSTTFRGPGVFLVNERFGREARDPGDMSEEEVQHMMTSVSRDRQAHGGSDPSMAATLLARKAAHAIYAEADFSEGIIWAYAWTESLLSGILMATAWEDGIAVEETRGWFRTQLVRRTKKYLKQQIGGEWNLGDVDSSFGRWHQSVALLRHRIIHSGYDATDWEANEAHSACTDLQEHVKGLLAARCGTYLRTAGIFLGLPGLERFGVLSDDLAAKLDEIAASEKSWLQAYVEYSNEVARD